MVVIKILILTEDRDTWVQKNHFRIAQLYLSQNA